MKHLCLGVSILLLCLSVCLAGQWYLRDCVEKTVGLLDAARSASEDGLPEEAAALAGEAHRVWEARRDLCGIILVHQALDEVDHAFQQLKEHSVHPAGAKFAAAANDLSALLRQIRRSEALYYYNILAVGA